ncbi:hypothetical protein MSAN_02417000 [Mycena sanguinolenta]|uniref:DUF202 domain-containing protein n=1 Tax=Mycena sanguinolenta TaxID=230812 RepID=A0A8H7CDV3_9AGAR|nr:hypothetical protein MSAN_02417000 [Mycena sanguinolenta]
MSPVTSGDSSPSPVTSIQGCNELTPLLSREHLGLDAGHLAYLNGTPRDAHSAGSMDPLVSRYSRGLSLVLVNSGSTARDHLASERTFLAYTRTSLTIASAAVALTQLFAIYGDPGNQLLKNAFELYAHPVAVCLIILSLYVLVVGVSRYFEVQVALIDGHFPTTRFHAGVITFSLGAIIVVLFALLIAGTAIPH